MISAKTKVCALLMASLSASVLAVRYPYEAPYDLHIYDSNIPENLAKVLADSERNSSAPSYETFLIKQVDGDGVDRYLCKINPEAAIQRPEPPKNTIESQSEVLGKAMALIQSSLSPKSCVWAYDLRGLYWTYAFCNGDKIIQYHEGAPPGDRKKKHVPSHPSTVFVLGRFSPASMSEIRFSNQASSSQYMKYLSDAGRTATLLDDNTSPFTHQYSQKAVSQVVTDGSVCDMTRQPRTIEVIYKCDAKGSHEPQILDVLEIKTCHYKMFLHVPSLCSYEPFVPNKKMQEAIVDINCQKVGPSVEHAPVVSEAAAFFDLATSNVTLRDHSIFPIPAGNRIDIGNQFLAAVGRGFYFAKSKIPVQSSSEFVNHRNVVLFTGFYNSLNDLNGQFARIIYNTMDKSLLAPGPGENGPLTLQWKHSFIIWFEIYDYKGELLGISRIEHDASAGGNVLRAQLLDPVNLLDSEGDMAPIVKFERPEFDAPFNMWNFQFFSETGQPLPSKAKVTASEEDQDDALVELSKKIIAYNRGLMENSSVIMELVDVETGEIVHGHYNEDSQFVFELEVSPGDRQQFTIKPMGADQDFVEYTVSTRVVSSDKSNQKGLNAQSEVKKQMNGEEDLQTEQESVSSKQQTSKEPGDSPSHLSISESDDLLLKADDDPPTLSDDEIVYEIIDEL